MLRDKVPTPKNLYQTIWIYNLELDLDSYVLAAAHDWVEGFSKYCEELIVVSTHCGRTQLPKNVRIVEISGGNLLKRVRALARLLKLIPTIWAKRKNSVVFHHMSPKTVIALGFFYNVFQIPQALWYSHSENSTQFQLAKKIVDIVFTPYPGTAPGGGNKFCYVGHGISPNRFRFSQDKPLKTNNLLGSVGRITPIKNFDKLIAVIKNNEATLTDSELKVMLVGPSGRDISYMKSLIESIHELSIEFSFTGAVPYEAIFGLTSKFDLYYSGTPESIDKAAVEAGLSGCLIITENKAVLELCGVKLAWTSILGVEPSSLEDQILTLSKISETKKTQMRRIISANTSKNNALDGTIVRILDRFDQEKTISGSPK